MNWIEQFLVTFFGFLSALGVYSLSQLYLNFKEKKNEKIKQKNFLSLIKDENSINKDIIERLRNQDFKIGETILRLKTENKNTECEIYSRVVGYLRPVKQWNRGKQQEFSDRKTFDTIKKKTVVAR